MSPEKEFCEFVAELVKLTQPQMVIETGVGQGFLARRLKPQLREGQQLVCFEEDPEWREALASLEFFDGTRCRLSAEATPAEVDFVAADLCVFDSEFKLRYAELEAWWQWAKRGAIVVLHDVKRRLGETSGHTVSAQLIENFGIPGFFLKNPRGGFVGVKP